MNQANDFVILDGILVEYRGNDRIVRVPEGVRGICSKVFQDSQPEEVYLPEGLVWLADAAFCGQIHLRRLVLPGSLRFVPPEMCRGCPALEEVVIPEGVVCLSECAFMESGLRSIAIPDSVRSIRDSCFQECRQLKEVSLGRSVQHLRPNAFASCENLQTISVPASLRILDHEVFRGCSHLKAVRIEEGLLYVGNSTFADCPQLREIELPKSLEAILDETFGKKPTIERVTFQGNRVIIRGFSDICPATVIRAPRMRPEWFPPASRPAALKGYLEMKAEGWPLVPEIVEAWEAFAAGTDPDSPENPAEPFRIADGILSKAACTKGRVVVPDGVTGIRMEAFQQTSIREIHLPDSIEWIHSGAFLGCDQLKEVRLPAGLTRIPDYLFADCLNLRSIQIPNTVIRIEGSAFAYTGLETVVLPPSLETIGDSAFKECSQLKHVQFPGGLQEIGENAFCGRNLLTEVTLPDSLEFLGKGAFKSCSDLEHLSIGTGLCRLNAETFESCHHLRNVTISADLWYIGEECFSSYSDGSIARLKPKGSSLQIVAPNAEPTILSEPLLPPLLTGFASKDGKGFRYEEMYLELLRLYRREIWDSEPVIRFLLAHDMLEREDIPDCLELLQDREDHDLVAEVLEYSHRRFPEPGAPLLLE